MTLTLLSVNNYNYARGGAEVVFLRHNDMLKEAGWRVALFCMEHEKNLPTTWSGSFVEKIEYGDSPLPLRERLRKGFKSVYSLEARTRIDDLLQRLNPDICHVHNVYHHISPSILGLIHDRGFPLVMTVHDLKIACPAYSMLTHDGVCERCRPGGLFHVLTNLCMKGNLALSALVMLESYLHRLLGSYAAVDRFIVPSMFYLDKLVDWGFEAGRFDYVPNFIDAAAYEPKTEPGDRFVYFGRLAPEKGLVTLVKAASLAGVRLDIIGEGPLKQPLQLLGRDLAVDVRFPGYLSGKSLHDAVREARAVVVPSEWYENAPVSVLEAFALGKPALVAAIGGLPELVVDGESGWHFDSGSVEHLAQRLREIADTPDSQIQERGVTALDRVKRHFSPRRYIEDIRTVYGRMGVLWN
jgi:glycosyltransferase involved in cell wall biosynthesis